MIEMIVVGLFSILLLLLYVLSVNTTPIDWSEVDKTLEHAISEHIFPGCAALVANKDGILYAKYFGNLIYDETAPKVDEQTIFDLASLTKVFMTTTAIEQFYERKELQLNNKIADYFPDYAQHGKGIVTIENCLLHNAGLQPDPTPRYYQTAFGCPESEKYHPKEVTSCWGKIKASVMAETPVYPIGEKCIYSDLSMITLMFVVGQLAKKLEYVKEEDLLPFCAGETETYESCYYEAYVRKHVIDKMNLTVMKFKPNEKEKNHAAPAWNDSVYRHELIQGFVSDGNSYANGGICGHAGLFSNILDMSKILLDFMFHNTLVSAKTIDLFTKVKNPAQSSRALGWDTNVYQNSTCAPLSANTYLHTGYTGTQVCNDREREMFTILLTNRCYPNDGQKTEIIALRKKFNQVVRDIYDKHYPRKH